MISRNFAYTSKWSSLTPLNSMIAYVKMDKYSMCFHVVYKCIYNYLMFVTKPKEIKKFFTVYFMRMFCLEFRHFMIMAYIHVYINIGYLNHNITVNV